MADKKQTNNTEKQIPNNVISLDASRCKGEGCKAKATRADFCEEHFVWFKEGLINKMGQKVPDFDKKYYAWAAAHPRKKVA